MEKLIEYALDTINLNQDDFKFLESFSNQDKFIRFRKLSKIVYDKNEDNIEKLTTVFSSVSNLDSDICYVLINKKSSLEFYIGTISNDLKTVNYADDVFSSNLRANFTGCEISDVDSNFKSRFFKEIDKKSSVTLTTALPSFKNKEESKEKFIQSLDKFIRAMEDKEYVAVFLAKNVKDLIGFRKEGLEELYTLLYPYLNSDIAISTNESVSVGESDSQTFSKSISESISKSISIQKPSAAQKAQMNLGAVNQVPGLPHFINRKTINKIKSDEYYTLKNNSETNTNTTTTTKSSTKTTSVNITQGSSIQQTIKLEDRHIKTLIEEIDKHLERIDISKNYGLYDFAAYFFADERSVSIMAANIYNSLIRGEESHIKNSYTFTYTNKEADFIKKSLKNFSHPVFAIEKQETTITTMINSKELAIAMSLPKKSVNGITIKEMVEFGVNYKNPENNYIELGNLYHLGKEYKNKPIRLNLDDLTMHTLLVGSTGAGKSTTTYNIIKELLANKINVLVIEPTKGEYKNVFGDEFDVYGTNKKITPLLRINPFSFEKDIHVLEHVDRLVEVFNACWPMYAAMPVVLKDAILKAYENCGWDLDESENKENIFPTFEDVLDALEEIIESSEYSDNTKADYKGALLTRIEALTKGLLGNIFVENELSSKELFDKNVIVDISRIGSSETKSLIMGILLLKQQEYRMCSNVINARLKHITILEEAHHLLPRVNKEVSAESANIKGKAVEMLSNSIAEMRTYGEGFLIIDQSPNMLDVSAIKNTNTKIVLRLPEKDDKTDIGKSLSLTDEQINEISKLERGVGIVYQNGWEEAILCKMKKHPKVREKEYKYTPPKSSFIDKTVLIKAVLNNNKKLFLKEAKNRDKVRSFSIEERLKLLDELLDLKKIYNLIVNKKDLNLKYLNEGEIEKLKAFLALKYKDLSEDRRKKIKEFLK